MACEVYFLNYDGRRLCFDSCDDEALARSLIRWNGEGAYAGPFDPCCTLGDENLLCCMVYRAAGGAGGLFAVRDGNGLLLAAVARTNLAFVQGLTYFARTATYARYASDIFEHVDDDDD